MRVRGAGPFGQFDIGEVAAAPVLIPGARNTERHAVDSWHVGKGQGEGGSVSHHRFVVCKARLEHMRHSPEREFPGAAICMRKQSAGAVITHVWR